MAKPHQCTVCQHNKLAVINRDLILGMSVREVAAKYAVSKDAANRHNRNHIDETLRRKVIAANLRDQQVMEQQEITGVLNDERVEVQGGLKRCIGEIERILEEAKGDEDRLTQLSALKEMRSASVDLAKIYSGLRASLTINVALTDSPEWLELRSILVEVFGEHPAAGKAFVERARRLNVTLPRHR